MAKSWSCRFYFLYLIIRLLYIKSSLVLPSMMLKSTCADDSAGSGSSPFSSQEWKSRPLFFRIRMSCGKKTCFHHRGVTEWTFRPSAATSKYSCKPEWNSFDLLKSTPLENLFSYACSSTFSLLQAPAHCLVTFFFFRQRFMSASTLRMFLGNNLVRCGPKAAKIPISVSIMMSLSKSCACCLLMICTVKTVRLKKSCSHNGYSAATVSPRRTDMCHFSAKHTTENSLSVLLLWKKKKRAFLCTLKQRCVWELVGWP